LTALKFNAIFDAAYYEVIIITFTGCFTTWGHYCRRWFPRSLWSKNFISTCVRFWTVTVLWPLET